MQPRDIPAAMHSAPVLLQGRIFLYSFRDMVNSGFASVNANKVLPCQYDCIANIVSGCIFVAKRILLPLSYCWERGNFFYPIYLQRHNLMQVKNVRMV